MYPTPQSESHFEGPLHLQQFKSVLPSPPGTARPTLFLPPARDPRVPRGVHIPRKRDDVHLCGEIDLFPGRGVTLGGHWVDSWVLPFLPRTVPPTPPKQISCFPYRPEPGGRQGPG